MSLKGDIEVHTQIVGLRAEPASCGNEPHVLILTLKGFKAPGGHRPVTVRTEVPGVDLSEFAFAIDFVLDGILGGTRCVEWRRHLDFPIEVPRRHFGPALVQDLKRRELPAVEVAT